MYGRREREEGKGGRKKGGEGFFIGLTGKGWEVDLVAMAIVG